MARTLRPPGLRQAQGGSPSNPWRIQSWGCTDTCREERWPSTISPGRGFRPRTETHWGTDVTFNVFQSDTRKLLAIIATADWSAEGIEQFFEDADEDGYTLIWFTVDQELAKLPQLAGRLLIPPRAERENDSHWRCFVVLGPGEEQPLVYAMRALTLMCARETDARSAVCPTPP